VSVVTFGSNIASLKAQRQLGKATADVRTVSERLSSGLRINHASDDAAGLSIASALNADRRVFDQGVRNLNDGISLLNVADGATEQLSTILIRLKELAEQAANGTYGSKQRKALDSEAQALSKEYFRIVQTTSFNGQSLFSPSMVQLGLQGGYGSNGAITGSLGGSVGTGTFGTPISQGGSFSVGDTLFALGDLNGDGILDRVISGSSVTVGFGRGDGTFQIAQTLSISASNIMLSDFNNDGWLDIAMDDFNRLTIALGNGNGSFRVGMSYLSLSGGDGYSLAAADFNGDGFTDILRDSELRLGQGDGTFGDARSTLVNGYSFTTGDLNGDGNADVIATTNSAFNVYLGQTNGTLQLSQTYSVPFGANFGGALADVNCDGFLDFGNSSQSGVSFVIFGRGNGTFGGSVSFQMDQANSDDLAFGDLNGDGLQDIVSTGANNANSGTVTIRFGNGDGSFRASASYQVQSDFTDMVALADLNNDGVLDVLSAGSSEIDTLLGNATSGIGMVLPFSLSTRANALQAMGIFDSALKRINTQRGTIGALQSRVASGLANLQTASENYATAASRITDADIAEESANLVRNRIIQFAGAAVLSQANQQPALVLRLLDGID